MTATRDAEAPEERRWRARPVVGGALRVVLLAIPLVASFAAVWAVARALPPAAGRSWWGLLVLLGTGLVVAVVVERAARRLLPIALLLQLSMIFPDRAPSRLRLARAAAVRAPRDELFWSGGGLEPVSSSQLVLSLVAALGSHDRRTRGHSERVRLLCDMLAAELKLDEQDRDRLRWAALLHDVGKVEVSTRILNKPAQLTTGEFERIRLHPAAGAALAAPLLPWLGPWGDGILDHHERYDGTGYPSGKAGEQISVAGRIIGLVDAFETMTATRPYKKAMATRAAREELARCSGAHFDPVYVRAFLAISLPRMLWAVGPLSFLLQLPFLQPLAQTGLRATAAAPQAAAAAAAGTAGAAALATGALTGVPPADVDQAGERRLTTGLQEAEQPVAAVTAGASATAPQPAPTPATARVPSAAATALPVAQPSQAASAAPASARPVAAPAPSAGGSTPTPAPPPAPAPAASGQTEHPVILRGPESPTDEREATFELVEKDGVQWECQLQRNASGATSKWEPCSGEFTVTVVRDGEHVLRVRDAADRDVLADSWQWTVRSGDAKR